MSIKKIVLSICFVLLSLIILLSTLLSYSRLDHIPYGFHVDEYSSSVNIGCLATEGIDAHHVRYPMFANLDYGTPKPPTYIYPGLVWSRIFGYSIPSLRALCVTVHILGIVGLFFLAHLLFGWRYALLTMTVASLSPWTWGLGRVAFESLFSATFLIWGLCFFFKSPKILSTILSGLFFAAAMYGYPPFRLEVPLMILTLFIYAQYKNPRAINSWFIFIIAMGIASIPLIQKTLTEGDIQQRFNTISIFSKDYLASIHSSGHLVDIVGIFINNYLLHFTPDFLVQTGDPSYVHSTRHFGILGWLDITAIILGLIWALMLFIKKCRSNNPLIIQKYFLIFLFINILIGVVPAGLTNSELPNSLRITAAWPFTCLLSSYLLWQSCERFWGLWIAVSIVSILFAYVFFNVYFKVYPQEGKGMFAYWTLDEANQVKTDEDWLKFLVLYRYKDYTARYYLMQYRGLTCTQSQNAWQAVGDILKKRGMY